MPARLDFPNESFPMALDRETVRRIAHLARLKVPEAELDGLAGELNNILSWVEQLDALDTTNVEPKTRVVASSPCRRWSNEGPDGSSMGPSRLAPLAPQDELLGKMRGSS